MKKLILEIELEYDENIMHGQDPCSIAWFNREVIGVQKDCGLILHSNEIGDEVGKVTVLSVKDAP